jgi:hypothetical protein
MMSNLLRFLRNDHIQNSLMTGFCIIILTLFFKKILHIPVPLFESSFPGLMFAFYEAAREKGSQGAFSRVEPWNLATLMVTGLIMLRHLIW